MIIICETPDGCTCGAPASTPSGMHHCDCAAHPGWCRQVGCLPCEENGTVRTRPYTPDPDTCDICDICDEPTRFGSAICTACAEDIRDDNGADVGWGQ